MSWDQARQALTCDTLAGACVAEMLASSAVVARSKARSTGWETSRDAGDRCPAHRVSRPRVKTYIRERS